MHGAGRRPAMMGRAMVAGGMARGRMGLLAWVVVVALAALPRIGGFSGAHLTAKDVLPVAWRGMCARRGLDAMRVGASELSGSSSQRSRCAGWRMIGNADSDFKDRQGKKHRSRAPALFFRDSDSTDVMQDMPVELIKVPASFQFGSEPGDSQTVGQSQSNFGESYWLEYVLKVVCDVCEKKSEPVKSLTELESAYLDGRIEGEAFEKEKQRAVKEFWASLVSDGTTKRNIQAKELDVQVTNSAQFVDSWIKKHILDKGEKTIGLAVQWNMRGSKAVQRDRISLIQIAVKDSVLIVQLAQMQPPTLPSLLRSVLSDDRIRKVGSHALSNAIKLQKDWGVKVIGRVDACDRAAILGYCPEDGALSDVARSVLALDYAMPRSLTRGDWSVAALTDMQLTCAALEAWVAREALLYMELLTSSEIISDKRVASSALAMPDTSTSSRSGGSAASAGRMGAAAVAAPGRRGGRLGSARSGDEDRLGTVRSAEPDRVLYLPKVDVRKGGSCAHWIWRGTRISEQHVARYCDVEIEVEEYPTGEATVLKLWGEDSKVKEAVELVAKLLARSQVESHCLALGMTVPQYIDRPTEDGGIQTTALVNQMELVDWSFFPSRLTKLFTGAEFRVRGLGQRRDALRASFFSQADAAAKVADELLGRHRPGIVVGPLPPGLDPGLMWRISGYSL